MWCWQQAFKDLKAETVDTSMTLHTVDMYVSLFQIKVRKHKRLRLTLMTLEAGTCVGDTSCSPWPAIGVHFVPNWLKDAQVPFCLKAILIAQEFYSTDKFMTFNRETLACRLTDCRDFRGVQFEWMRKVMETLYVWNNFDGWNNDDDFKGEDNFSYQYNIDDCYLFSGKCSYRRKHLLKLFYIYVRLNEDFFLYIN